MSDAEKLFIAYYPRGSFTSQHYEVTAPYGWENMTPKERERWARHRLRRKNSSWEYIQISGYPY